MHHEFAIYLHHEFAMYLYHAFAMYLHHKFMYNNDKCVKVPMESCFGTECDSTLLKQLLWLVSSTTLMVSIDHCGNSHGYYRKDIDGDTSHLHGRC
jgi:hypothetical protein